MTPNASTILSWFFYLIPVYLFVIAPLLQQIFPPDEPSSSSSSTSPSTSIWGADLDHNSIQYDAEGNEIPGLNLEDDSFISPEDDVPVDCAVDGDGDGGYKTHILSREPLVIYIEGFLSEREADHLVDVSVGHYKPSIVYDGTTEKIDPSIRLSDRALLARDNTVRCLEERARAFQGWRPHLYIERMWAQRYNTTGHYRHHYDWAGSAGRGGDRLSTFMVYLGADCVGGGTNFPRLRMPDIGTESGSGKGSSRWCEFLECEESEGVTFRPIKGNAIFWENLRADGRGIPETWHGAYPVREGSKVGLNIWSWYQPVIGRQR